MRENDLNGMFLSILKNAMRPDYFGTMAHKLVLRADRALRREDRAVVRGWCAAHASDVEAFARGRDPELWEEAVDFGAELQTASQTRLEALGVPLGGGGHYPLLYFLTRLRKPTTVVETGVAAGFSTQAVLSALDRNGSGRLYSSDFPYFRLEEPERFIGCLVEERLKGRWMLNTQGDRKALPKILAAVERIELLHYDSDKSYSGRRFALRTLGPKLSPDALIVMDDIQDNGFFRDYIEQTKSRFQVFEFRRKYLGLIWAGRDS